MQIMVMQEMEKLRDTFVPGCGDYRNHLDKVTPSVPATLPALPRALTQHMIAEVLRYMAEREPLEYRRNRMPRPDSAELAAWTTMASVILNLDETITKQVAIPAR